MFLYGERTKLFEMYPVYANKDFWSRFYIPE